MSKKNHINININHRNMGVSFKRKCEMLDFTDTKHASHVLGASGMGATLHAEKGAATSHPSES